MNILMCTTRMGIGGTETHVLTLARELVRCGNSVCVASSGGMLADSLAGSGIRHISLPLDKNGLHSLADSTRGLLEAVRAFKPDIIHVHGRIPAFVCGILRKKPGFPPVVATVHGMYAPSPYKKLFSYWGDGTIAVSGDIREYLCGVYGLERNRIDVIRNGIAAKKTEKTPHDSVNILMCSRTDDDTYRACMQVIGLMPALRSRYAGKKLVLHIAGDGSRAGELKQAARDADRLSGVSGSVIFHGALPDVSVLYPEADIFVGSSRSLMEAVGAGIPSVMLSPGKCICDGFVTCENIEKLANINFVNRGISEISGNPEKAADTDDMLYACLCSGIDNICAYGAALGNDITDACAGYIGRENSIEKTAAETFDFYKKTIYSAKGGIMLCGYFGAGNAGDDAALKAVCADIKKFAPDAEIYVTVRSKKSTHAFLPEGTVPLSKYNLHGIKKRLRRSRLFVLCGGTLLQNSTSNRSLYYYCRLAKAAAKAGCRTMLWGGGIGPLRGKHAVSAAGDVLNILDFSGFRDSHSLGYADGIAPEGKKALTSDPALSAVTGGVSAVKYGKNVIAVTPRKIGRFYGKKCEKELEQLLCDTCSALKGADFKPVFIPLAPEDRPLCRRLAKKCGCESSDHAPFEIITDEIKKCAGCISIRLHGAVFACACGVPCVCIAYDPKVSSFASDTDIKCFPAAALPDADTLAKAVYASIGQPPRPLYPSPADACAAAELYLL